MKPQVYIDPRPAEYFDRYHERARTKRPDWIYRLARVVLTPPVLSLYRYRAIDVANVPERGPVLLAPNHFSYLDHFFVAVLLRREVQFMAKSQLFRPPILDFILSHGGTFPVRRGHRDEDAFITAHSIFDHGGTVLMYAEGGRQRTKEMGQPKPGLGRLALESGVPVVPIAIHGSEHAREAKRGALPKVTVQFGAPLRFEQIDRPSRERSQEVAELVFDRVRLMYEALAKNGRAGVLESLRRERGEGAPVPG